MPNYRTKRKYSTQRFKSHTDVNNYNNFLLELDRKQLDTNQQETNNKQILHFFESPHLE